MDMQQIVSYGAGTMFLAVALYRRSRSIKIRRFNGNMFSGKNSGTVNQSYTSNDRNSDSSGSPKFDVVTFVIGIVGIAISGAQLWHDIAN
jgi:hypothetical protein